MKPWLDDGDVRLYHGNAGTVLYSLPTRSVQTVVTSPPYWGLRDYGETLQIGLEKSPEEYVESIVETFWPVRDVLRDDGTVWLVLGDSYAGGAANSGGPNGERADGTGRYSAGAAVRVEGLAPKRGEGLKPKDLVGIPWRVAFALQADGWYLRSDIIWSKANPMPESVTDRPTKAHEYLFLLTKRARYYFDQEAVREPHSPDGRLKTVHDHATPNSHPNYDNVGNGNERWPNSGRNVRSVWEIATQPTPDAHFATFPEELVRRCILAGSKPGDTILDPFVGSGTTCLVARKHGRRAIGTDLNESYLQIAARRLGQQSLFGGVAV